MGGNESQICLFQRRCLASGVSGFKLGLLRFDVVPAGLHGVDSAPVFSLISCHSGLPLPSGMVSQHVFGFITAVALIFSSSS